MERERDCSLCCSTEGSVWVFVFPNKEPWLAINVVKIIRFNVCISLMNK